MERNARNWVHVLGSRKQQDLVAEIREGLTRKGHSVCLLDRDLPAHHSEDPEVLAIRLAVAVVVVSTPDLYREPKTERLLSAAEYRRCKVILVVPGSKPRRPARHEWKVSAVIARSGSAVALVDSLDEGLRRQLAHVSFGSRKPQGRRSTFVFFSYSARNGRLHARLAPRIESLGLRLWDYGKSPRQGDVHHHDELDRAIGDSKAVLVMLTAAWEKSEECRREVRAARKAGIEPIWLRCDDRAGLPAGSRGEPVISLRSRDREAGLRELEALLFPSRRESKLT